MSELLSLYHKKKVVFQIMYFLLIFCTTSQLPSNFCPYKRRQTPARGNSLLFFRSELSLVQVSAPGLKEPIQLHNQGQMDFDHFPEKNSPHS